MIRVTTHAAEKMQSRGVTLTEVEECVLKPEVTYGRGHDEIRQRGQVAVSVRVAGEVVTVCTVLLRHQERWTDADARARHEVAR